MMPRGAFGRRRACALAATIAAGAMARAEAASAQTLALRADAVAQTQAPVGLVVLQAEDRVRPWLTTEASLWGGSKEGDPADILVFCIHLHHPKGYGDLRAGRFVLATGAVRPVQIDGADVVSRTSFGSSLEAFGGMPVVPAFGSRDYDWVAGGRVAQTVAGALTTGVSFLEQRTTGEVSADEAGLDVAFAPTRYFDLAARGSLDLESQEVPEATASAASTVGPLRLELFATHRSPSLLVPATSLFSVLGDVPSETGGATLRWKAAPRLDLLGSGAVQSVAGDLGGNGWLRATLRLDDHGDGSVGLELRRQAVSTARWTGVRVVASQKLPWSLRASTELELAAPDAPTDGVTVWPWGLLALAWTPRKSWEVAAAFEASSTPVDRYSTAALLRLSHTLEVAAR
jgi:hypothetical protein